MLPIPFRPLLARLIIDASFRREAILLGPEALLAPGASAMERALLLRVGNEARTALLDDMASGGDDDGGSSGGTEISIPPGAVSRDTEISIPPGASSTSASTPAAPPRRVVLPSNFSSSLAASRVVPALRDRIASLRGSTSITPIPIPDRGSLFSITPIPIPRIAAPGSLPSSFATIGGAAVASRFEQALAGQGGAAIALATFTRGIQAAAAIATGAGTEVGEIGRRIGGRHGDALASLGDQLGRVGAALASIEGFTAAADVPGAIETIGTVFGSLLLHVGMLVDAIGSRLAVELLSNAAIAIQRFAMELAGFSAHVAAQVAGTVALAFGSPSEVGVDLSVPVHALASSVSASAGIFTVALADGTTAVLETVLSFIVGLFTAGANLGAGVVPSGDPLAFEGGGGLDLDDGSLGRIGRVLALNVAGGLDLGAQPSRRSGRVRNRNASGLTLRFAGEPSEESLRSAAAEVLAKAATARPG